MNTEIINHNGQNIAVVQSQEIVIDSPQSALDLVAAIGYEYQCHKIAINKGAVSDAFFTLSTGVAGEILQKFVNYNCQLAIYGDFSGYTSKPLKDFIYESNKGHHVFFAADAQAAVAFLSPEVQG